MNFRKILAVAVAVVVVGVVAVGMVSAASPITSTNDVLGGSPNGTMTMSYEVKLEAEMDVVDNGLSAAGITVNPTVVMGGNAGVVTVKTNYPRWDVNISFRNSGKLSRTGSDGWTQIPLKVADFAGTGTEDGTLRMSIVVLPESTNPGPLRGGVLIDSADVAAATNSAPLSIADSLGQGGGTSLTANIDGVSPAQIASLGFGPTLNTNGVRFGINVGLGAIISATRQREPRGNDNGIYSETIEFTMVASF